MTTTRGPAECWLTDMDGVLVHEGRALPGAADFLRRLAERERRFLVLTNNSIFTPRDLAARLARAGLQVPEGAIWTSALATAAFLSAQAPGGSAFVVGEAGLTTALHEAGYTLTDTAPDYVVLARRAPGRSRRSRARSGWGTAARASSPPIPTAPRRRPTGRCPPPARSRR